MKRFEYMTLFAPSLYDPKFLTHINKLGDEGFELVTVTREMSLTLGYQYVALFKRELPCTGSDKSNYKFPSDTF